MIIEFAESVRSIESTDWDRCAGRENPFVSHAFLATLEECHCVGEGTGWLSFPALLKEKKGGRPLAIAPSYIKLDSKGEYIFDYHWAEAYQRLVPGLSYYPKLQVAVPFSPVPGPRLLLDPALAPEQRVVVQNALLGGLRQACQKYGFSSAHITFCEREEARAATTRSGYLQRLSEQYHWFNEDYESFSDFLAQLTSRKRKNIKKERAKANSHPLTIHTLHGQDISDEQCLAFFRMYELTSLQKWGRPYLNYQFFRTLSRRLKEKFVLFLVRDERARWVAGAWNLRGTDALYGRNWGALEQYDRLHFEVCYYRAIEYAIEHKLKRVEAGAQGMHKIQRGYRPQAVYSAHHIESPSFRRAIDEYLQAERTETEYRLEALATLEPFRRESAAKDLSSGGNDEIVP